MSSGREPIASPPGSGTTARRQRATSGPEHAHRRPQLRHRPVVRLAPRARAGTSMATVSRSTVTAQPRLRSTSAISGTSRISGQLVSVVVPSASSAAAISLSTLFLAPTTSTEPDEPGSAGHREMLCHGGRRYLPRAPAGLPSPHGRAPDQDLHQDRRRRHHGARRLQPRPQDRRPARGLRRHRRGNAAIGVAVTVGGLAERRARPAAAGPERPVRRGRGPVHADRARTRSTRRCGSPRTT